MAACHIIPLSFYGHACAAHTAIIASHGVETVSLAPTPAKPAAIAFVASALCGCLPSRAKHHPTAVSLQPRHCLIRNWMPQQCSGDLPVTPDRPANAALSSAGCCYCWRVSGSAAESSRLRQRLTVERSFWRRRSQAHCWPPLRSWPVATRRCVVGCRACEWDAQLLKPTKSGQSSIGGLCQLCAAPVPPPPSDAAQEWRWQTAIKDCTGLQSRRPARQGNRQPPASLPAR